MLNFASTADSEASMGGAKRHWEAMHEGGLDLEQAVGKFVCGDCIADDDIANFITNNAAEVRCAFCGRQSADPIAAELSAVVRYMRRCIEREYADAAEQVMYISSEGGYVSAPTWDTWDLLDKIGLELPNDDGTLLGCLARAIGSQTWSEESPHELRQDEHLLYSWDKFCRFIQHERRYFFTHPGQYGQDEFGQGPLSPSDMLSNLARMCADEGLIRRINPGERYFRARPQDHGQPPYSLASELGPPPRLYATQSNRMSAAGIPIFYGAADATTAVLETKNPTETKLIDFTVGEFELTKAILVLDLTELPEIPGLFCADDVLASKRAVRMFLWAFRNDVEKPIARDDRVHVDYVPTQVVTEYFRVAVKHDGDRLSGIAYRSTRNSGGLNVALFAEAADVADPTAPPPSAWLILQKAFQMRK